MEYVLLTLLVLENIGIGYLFIRNKNKMPRELTKDQKEKERLERIQRDFQKLFNYTETIATKGYEDEE